MNHAPSGLSLHLNSGIPVLELNGEWHEDMQDRLRQAVEWLTQAGHYEIVLNLAHAIRVPLSESRWWRGINQLAGAVNAHYGRLGMVGTQEQIRASASGRTPSRWNWALSEEEVVCRFKGIPLAAAGPIVNVRIARC